MANYHNKFYGNIYLQNKGKASTDSYAKKQIPIEDDSIKKTVEDSPIYEAAPEVDAPMLSFDRDNLVTGIIFSEILGKPKARRRGW